MKTFLLILISIFYFQEIFAFEFFKPYDKGDYIREGACLFLIYLDWKQTKEKFSLKNQDKYYEINPFLGEKPTPEEIDRYVLSSVIFHIVTTWALSDMRDALQYITIGVEGWILYSDERRKSLRGEGIKIGFQKKF